LKHAARKYFHALTADTSADNQGANHCSLVTIIDKIVTRPTRVRPKHLFLQQQKQFAATTANACFDKNT
jgi:hypothetical protein